MSLEDELAEAASFLTRSPSSVGCDSIIEATCEFRFDVPNLPMSDLLLGPLYAYLHSLNGPSVTIDRMPLSQMPFEVRRTDSGLIMQAHTYIRGGQYSVGLGDAVVSLSCLAPYPGWDDFFSQVKSLVAVVLKQPVDLKVNRHSLLYKNVIPYREDAPTSFDPLELGVSAKGFDFSARTERYNAELTFGSIVVLLNATTQSSVTFSETGEVREGLYLHVDIIRNLIDRAALNSVVEEIDSLHTLEKKVFFGLLTETTYNSMQPKN